MARENIIYIITNLQPSIQPILAIRLDDRICHIEQQIGSMEKNMIANKPRQFIAEYINAVLDVFVKSMALVLSKIKEVLPEPTRSSIERF